MRRPLAAALQLAIAAALPGIASAAAPSMAFGAGLAALPWYSWAWTLALSTMAGLLSLLNRVRAELLRGPLVVPRILIAEHMLGAWLAGLVVFVVAAARGWSEAETLVGIIAASFVGAVAIERIAQLWLRSRFGVDVPTQLASEFPERRASQERRAAPPAPRRRREDEAPEGRHSSDFTPLDG